MTYSDEITFLLCEACFDIILEDDAEYHHHKSYCHHCIEEIRHESEEIYLRLTTTVQPILEVMAL